MTNDDMYELKCHIKLRPQILCYSFRSNSSDLVFREGEFNTTISRRWSLTKFERGLAQSRFETELTRIKRL